MPYLKRTWDPHPKQAQILDDDTRHRAVPAGRRFGKTKMARGIIVEYGFENPGSLVWFVAPNYTDAKELGFDPLLAEIPDDLLAGEPKESPPYEIYLTNGTRIQFRGQGAQGRGRGIDLVVIDEAGEIEDGYFSQVIRPSLIGTQGRVLAIGTPKGRNWFYDLYLRGEDPDDAEVNAHQCTSYDNPHVDDAEIDKERATTPDRVFRQEYLAKFVTDEGDVFGDVQARNCRPYAVEDVSGQAPYSTGVDIARQSDYLVATTLDRDGMLVGFLRDRGFSWASARRSLERYLSDFPGVCRMDATRDNPVIEDIARAVSDVRIEPVSFTRQSKKDLIETLAARLETEDIVIPEKGRGQTDALISELEAFTYETRGSGSIDYSAPDGYHDDTVDSLALAAQDSSPAKMTW